MGKTLVSSSLIDRVVAGLGRALWEVPVGFKWFVPGFSDGSVCFGGEDIQWSGLEVLAAMGKNPLISSIPVILLSAKGQVAEIEQGLQSGATRYLVKPFEPLALRTCVAEVLQEGHRQPVKE